MEVSCHFHYVVTMIYGYLDIHCHGILFYWSCYISYLDIHCHGILFDWLCYTTLLILLVTDGLGPQSLLLWLNKFYGVMLIHVRWLYSDIVNLTISHMVSFMLPPHDWLYLKTFVADIRKLANNRLPLRLRQVLIPCKFSHALTSLYLLFSFSISGTLSWIPLLKRPGCAVRTRAHMCATWFLLSYFAKN